MYKNTSFGNLRDFGLLELLFLDGVSFPKNLTSRLNFTSVVNSVYLSVNLIGDSCHWKLGKILFNRRCVGKYIVGFLNMLYSWISQPIRQEAEIQNVTKDSAVFQQNYCSALWLSLCYLILLPSQLLRTYHLQLPADLNTFALVLTHRVEKDGFSLDSITSTFQALILCPELCLAPGMRIQT